jgi:hypothetical protein
VGVWQAKGLVFVTTLSLRANGTFEQTFARGNVTERSNGKWTLEVSRGRSYIMLRHVDATANQSESRGVSTHAVKWSQHGLALEDDPDLDVYYVRLK